MEKQMKIPGPDHTITVAPTSDHVVVRVGDQVVARTDRALTLAEAAYADVQYVPIEDVDRTSLRRSDHRTYCPYKGDASYYTLVTPEGELENVIWTYEEPFEAVREIAGHVAFYADRDEAVELVKAAHQVCPYSNATRGNIEVALTTNGRGVEPRSDVEAV